MSSRIEQLREMLLEDPNDPFLHYAIGLELVGKKNYQEAMSAFQTVITLDENYVAAYYQLGIIFIEIDIVDVARTYIEKGIEKAVAKKDFRSKGELEELLEGIE
jgi:tetratricopeptide (TPR) repeat protein